MQWFVPFLAVILFIELLTNFLHYNIHDPSNPKLPYPTLWLSEISCLVLVGFFGFIFFHIQISKRQKQVLTIFVPVYLLLCVFCWFFLGLSAIFMPTLVAGGILMIVFAALVFYHCLRSDETILTNKMIAGLWIAAGVLIFFSGIEICIAARQYIIDHELKLFGEFLHRIIPRLLCVVLYPCLSISFIVWQLRHK